LPSFAGLAGMTLYGSVVVGGVLIGRAEAWDNLGVGIRFVDPDFKGGLKG